MGCYVEVYDQHQLRQGHLVIVPQLLQCWTGRAGILTRERVCSWLSVDLGHDVTDVYLQHWSLGQESLTVELVIFSEARACQEGSPFQNGARIVVCCNGETLEGSTASKLLSCCPAQPLCRALTQGLIEMSSGPSRSRECASRRQEINAILEQLWSVVQWTEEALKRCGQQEMNVECLVLVYDLLLGLSLGTQILERLDAAREQLRPEYTGIKSALCGLNLHISHLFQKFRHLSVETQELTQHDLWDEENHGDTLYHSMVHVTSRVLNIHSKVITELMGSCLPLEKLRAASSSVAMAACTCMSSRSARCPGVRSLDSEQSSRPSSTSGHLPPRPPGCSRIQAERKLPAAQMREEEHREEESARERQKLPNAANWAQVQHAFRLHPILSVRD